MIIYSRKNIYRWKYWRAKRKFTFCVLSGALYTVIATSFSLLIKLIFNTTVELLSSLLGIALASFIAMSFLSLALWYENERRYKQWLIENSEK